MDRAPAETSRAAQALLGHAEASTTNGYIRQRAGERANRSCLKKSNKPS